MASTLIRAAFSMAELGGPGCWEWKGHRWNGYGRANLKGRGVTGAHRYAYEAFYGPIPDGLTIDHLCRNRACVRPSHLEAVPNRVNALRGTGPTAQNAARTHCKKGHPFDMEIRRTRGNRAGTIERSCRTCRNLVYAENPEYREQCKARARAQKQRNKARRQEAMAMGGN